MPSPGETDQLIVDDAPAALLAELAARSETLATAESLTGGLLSAMLAGVPGASAVLRGGLIVYATDLKESLGGVDAATLAAHGPVAAETAAELAVGAMTRCDADWGISLTGVAGPDAQDGHPPGTVFGGLAYRGGKSAEPFVSTTRWMLVGGRWEIRLTSARHAIDMLRRVLV